MRLYLFYRLHADQFTVAEHDCLIELYGKIQSNDVGVNKVVGTAQFWNVTPAAGLLRSLSDSFVRSITLSYKQ